MAVAGFAAPAANRAVMTAAQLRKAELRFQRASRRAENAREARNRLVRDALEAGWTHARIADAMGLTRGRIGQIAQAAARDAH